MLRNQLKRTGVTGGIVAATLAAAMFGALIGSHSGSVTDWERTLAQAAYDLPSGTTPMFMVVMQAGTRGAIIVVFGVLVAFRRWPGAVAALFGGFATWAFVEIAKVVLDRARPDASALGRIPRDLADGAGFPSSHAAIAAALATVLVITLEGRYVVKAVVVALALLTAVARVHLGVHWPLDVVGGAAVGVLLGAVGGALCRGVYPGLSRAGSRAEQLGG